MKNDYGGGPVRWMRKRTGWLGLQRSSGWGNDRGLHK